MRCYTVKLSSSECRQQLLKFSWGYLKTPRVERDTSHCKYFAFLNVCHFLETFPAPDKIYIQVHDGLPCTGPPCTIHLYRNRFTLYCKRSTLHGPACTKTGSPCTEPCSEASHQSTHSGSYVVIASKLPQRLSCEVVKILPMWNPSLLRTPHSDAVLIEAPH